MGSRLKKLGVEKKKKKKATAAGRVWTPNTISPSGRHSRSKWADHLGAGLASLCRPWWSPACPVQDWVSTGVLVPGSQAGLSSSSPIGLGSQGGAGARGPGRGTMVKGSAVGPGTGAGGSGHAGGSSSGSRRLGSSNGSPQPHSTPPLSAAPAHPQLAAVDASDTQLFLRRNSDRRRPSGPTVPAPAGRRRCRKSP